GSRSPIWLETLGYERPPAEEVRIGLGYVTCHYPRTPSRFPNLNGIVILASPPSRRIAILLAQAANQWVLTVGGYLGDHAPTDYEGFLQSVRNLPTPEIYNMIRDLDPLDGPIPYGFPANLRHRYERLARFPEGFIVLGDALCSFNPIYGQGMTVAALEAAALDDCLSGGVTQLRSRFYTEASKIIDVSWNTAVGSDLAYPEVEGPRTPMVRFLNWYIKKLHKAAHTDAQVSIAFLKVINMVTPPPSILHPRIVGRVIRGNLWPRRTASDSRNEGTLSHAGTAG
ncbi:MAG: monooxygenase, partial [Caldilineaceae bacterium]